MSLLIKALQKAEQSKGEATEAPVASLSAAAQELELAPHHAGDEPSLREEGGFDGLTPAKTAASSQRQAAAVFRAGQSEDAGVSRTVWLAGGGALLLLLLAVGFYYYLQSLNQPELVIARRPVAPAPVAAPIQTLPVMPENTVAEPRPVDPPQEKALQKPESPVARSIEKPPVPVEQPDMIVAVGSVKPKARPVDDAAPKVTRSRAPTSSVSEGVLAGYRAYMAGDDVAASRQYRQAAQAEPRNVDAWQGLAAAAARQGKTDEATAAYMRVLELEPRNAVAQAGLVGLMAQSDPVAGESRLKGLIAQQPEAAFLHAALGNLYADQGQWPSAQQSYFQAYHFDSANAEYAFNLAVSLDQMGKTDLALTHYQRALELLPKQGGPVDRGQLESRIAQLRQVSNK
jgi:tetratricopeptide (TPR) repeat protein